MSDILLGTVLILMALAVVAGWVYQIAGIIREAMGEGNDGN